MSSRGLGQIAFRVAFACYAAGLVLWLAVGMLPVLVQHVPAVADLFGKLATGGGPLAEPAMMLLHPAVAMTGISGNSLLQYGFSLLNLVLGLLLIVRRPDELVPRLLALGLLGTAATFNLPSHEAFHVLGSPWPIALVHFTFHIVSGVSYLWAVVLFPDGKLPERIAVSARVLTGLAVAVTAGVAFVCWWSDFLAHPQFFVIFFGILIPVAGVGAQLLRVTDQSCPPATRRNARLLIAALLPALGVALIWCLSRMIAALGVALSPTAAGIADGLQDLFPAVFAIVPIVLFAGVLRYRLFDIDRLLSRVLVYGLIVVASGAVYLVAVVTGGVVLGGADWWPVLVLAAAAVALEPAWSLAGRWANRVVFGQDLGPADAMKTLISGLEQVSPSPELERLVDVCVRATRAARAELWLREGDHWSLRAAAPSPAAPGPAAPGPAVPNPAVRGPAAPGPAVPSPALPGPAAPGPATGRERAGKAIEPGAAAQAGKVAAPPRSSEKSKSVGLPAPVLIAGRHWPVEHQGVQLGMLTVQLDGGETLPTGERALVSDLAAQAGLLVNNAVLAEQLAEHVRVLTVRARELSVARRRLVAAQDRERRRVERDLHDGAQQTLVAVMLGMRMAAAQPPAPQSAQPDQQPPAQGSMVRQLLRELDASREELADLSSGQLPAALRDGGLRGGLEHAATVARRSGLDVQLLVDASWSSSISATDSSTDPLKGSPTDSLIDPEIAAAVYYCCSEALQNVVKYAAASQVSVEVHAAADGVTFAVTDDGAGLDPGRSADAAGGLHGLDDRVGVHGGWIAVDSAPGGGTRVRGGIPTQVLPPAKPAPEPAGVDRGVRRPASTAGIRIDQSASGVRS